MGMPKKRDVGNGTVGSLIRDIMSEDSVKLSNGVFWEDSRGMSELSHTRDRESVRSTHKHLDKRKISVPLPRNADRVYKPKYRVHISSPTPGQRSPITATVPKHVELTTTQDNSDHSIGAMIARQVTGKEQIHVEDSWSDGKVEDHSQSEHRKQFKITTNETDDESSALMVLRE